MHQQVLLRPAFLLSLVIVIGLLGAVACGTSPTPTPTNTPVAAATNTPTATSAVATPTATSATKVVATPTAATVPTPTPVPSVTPKRGGIMRELNTEDPPSFDPHTAFSAPHNQINAKLYSNLIWTPDSKSFVPDAAQAYEISGDGLVWTFHLRPNVKFQTGYTPSGPRDGTAVTAQDVKWSLEKIMGLHSDPVSERVGGMKEFIDIDRSDNGIEVVDNLTVKVHLVQAYSDFVSVLSLGFAGIVPDGIATKDMAKRPYGSGPFFLQNVQRGAQYSFVRNPDYFKPGLPYLDGIVQPIIQDTSVAQTAFLLNKVDIAGGNPSPSNKPLYDQKVKSGAIEMLTYESGCRPVGVVMNSTKPPFSDKRLREAVNLAIDRQAYSVVVDNGYDVPGVFLPNSLGKTVEQVMQLPGYRQPHDADLAQAKQIVQSLYPNGLDVTAMVRNTGNYPTESEFVAGELKKIGINLTLQLQDTTVTQNRATKLDYIIWPYLFCNVTNTASELFGTYFVTGGARNWFGYSDPKVDAGFRDMAATSDPVLKKQKAQALEDIVYSFLPVAPVPGGTSTRSSFSYLQGLSPQAITNYFWMKQELVWRSDV